MAVYTFTRDSTPPMPGSDLDRDQRRLDRDGRFARDLVSGASWERFCDGLRAAGRAVLLSEDAADDTDLAEGYQYLLGLVHSLVERELYRTDAANPAFLRAQSDVVKVGMDNPDATLLSAPLCDDGVFRIYGRVGPLRMLELVVMGAARPVMHYLGEFEVGPGGTFEVALARDPQPGNWIGLPDGADSVLVRGAFYDWDTEEVPHLAIERLDADGGARPACLRTPTPASVGEQLDALGGLVEANAHYWIDMVHSFRDGGDNSITPPRPLPATGMNPSRSSVKGFFVLGPEEALIVEFTPPEGLFWSISIGDIWYRTIDFTHHQTSLNGGQARVDPDGVARFVISHRDPGVANWLDTTGHERGVIVLRWIMVTDRPQPITRVVAYSDLPEALPAETSHVTPEQRMATVARRRDAAARRYASPLTTRWSYSTAAIDPLRTAGQRPG